MSEPVSLDDLRSQIEVAGPVAFLLTVTEAAEPHAVAVEVAWEEDFLVATAGNRTAANARHHPSVSVLWPAQPPAAYSLIVDGSAEVHEGDDGNVVSIRPLQAVLHRSPAAAGDGPTCMPVLNHD